MALCMWMMSRGMRHPKESVPKKEPLQDQLYGDQGARIAALEAEVSRLQAEEQPRL